MFKQVSEKNIKIIGREDYDRFERITKVVQSDLTLSQVMLKVKNYRQIYKKVSFKVSSVEDLNKTFTFDEAIELASSFIKELTICEYIKTSKDNEETNEDTNKSVYQNIKEEVVLIVKL